MNEVIIEMVAQIVCTFILMLIGVAGTWLTAQIVKRNELANIAAATHEATDAAQRVVMETFRHYLTPLAHADNLYVH